MKRREIIEFEVGKMEFGGTSSTVIGKRNVNMKGGITGQKVKASVKKANSQKAEVKLLEVLEKSPLETEQACNHFGQCGGCTILSLPYEKQLELKKQQILDLFESHDITGFEFLGIESSPNNTCYRNKMEFTFGNEMKDGPLTIGMHKKGRHIDILTVDGCMLIDQDFIKILTATEEFFRAEGLPYYRGNDHKGYLRHLVVRKGIKTNEMMVMIVTSTQLDYDMDKYKDMLLGLDLEADLASVLHCLNDNLADAVKCDELRVLHGRDFVGDYKDKVLYDLYSGTGTIGQVLSQKARKVYGIEIVEEAVEAANENAKLNGLTHCEFIAGDVAKTVNSLKERPDIIIVDPPRPGIHKDAVRDISKFNAEEIIYISCNPKTLVVDLQGFESYGYEVKKVRCMDMFPNTPHCETVVLLQRKDK